VRARVCDGIEGRNRRRRRGEPGGAAVGTGGDRHDEAGHRLHLLSRLHLLRLPLLRPPHPLLPPLLQPPRTLLSPNLLLSYFLFPISQTHSPLSSRTLLPPATCSDPCCRPIPTSPLSSSIVPASTTPPSPSSSNPPSKTSLSTIAPISVADSCLRSATAAKI